MVFSQVPLSYLSIAQAAALLGALEANNNGSGGNFSTNVNGNAFVPQLGGTMQGVLGLFQQRQVELESNFQTLTRLLEAALQQNPGQQHQLQQSQGIGNTDSNGGGSPGVTVIEENNAATRTNDNAMKSSKGKEDNGNAKSTTSSSAAITGSSKKKTTPEAVSNGRVMGQVGDAIVPCRARGLARNHNTRVRCILNE